jgi:hypothetical protein
LRIEEHLDTRAQRIDGALTDELEIASALKRHLRRRACRHQQQQKDG